MQSKLVTLLVALSAIAGSVQADWESCVAGRTCPESWQLYGKHCFKFFNQRSTWAAANAACQGLLADQLSQYPEYRPTLAAVKGAGMNSFIYGLYDDGLIGIDTLNGQATDLVSYYSNTIALYTLSVKRNLSLLQSVTH